MYATTVGLAEGIINDTCLVSFLSCSTLNNIYRTERGLQRTMYVGKIMTCGWFLSHFLDNGLEKKMRVKKIGRQRLLPLFDPLGRSSVMVSCSHYKT